MKSVVTSIIPTRRQQSGKPAVRSYAKAPDVRPTNVRGAFDQAVSFKPSAPNVRKDKWKGRVAP